MAASGSKDAAVRPTKGTWSSGKPCVPPHPGGAGRLRGEAGRRAHALLLFPSTSLIPKKTEPRGRCRARSRPASSFVLAVRPVRVRFGLGRGSRASPCRKPKGPGLHADVAILEDVSARVEGAPTIIRANRQKSPAGSGSVRMLRERQTGHSGAEALERAIGGLGHPADTTDGDALHQRAIRALDLL